MSTYIEEKHKEFAMNIDEYQIHQIVNFCGRECRVVDKTSNSIMLFVPKNSESGIDSYQWFDMRMFNKYLDGK